ncbi:hypothetical protein D3C78_1550130 [compost metagenome]
MRADECEEGGPVSARSDVNSFMHQMNKLGYLKINKGGSKKRSNGEPQNEAALIALVHLKYGNTARKAARKQDKRRNNNAVYFNHFGASRPAVRI